MGRPRITRTRTSLPYQRRESLLTRGELAFYRVMRRALRGHFGISIKTRLADVVKCPEELWDTAHGRRLSQKHVDFVLYDRFTAAIVAVVELDDRTHDRVARRSRDFFLARVLRGAGVQLIRIRAASWYSLQETALEFAELVKPAGQPRVDSQK